MNLLDLMVKIGVKDEASAKVAGLAGNIGGKLKTAAKVGVAAVAAVGAAVGVAGTAVWKAANATADYGDHIDKMSQKIGFSAEAYQKWSYVMDLAGANVDSLQTSMKTLSTQAQSNAEEFQKLGIAEEEVATLSKEDLFGRVIEGLSGMEDGTERTAIASKLLGKSATELAPLLNQGTDAIKDQMEMAERYGLIMSDKAVKASAAFKDSLTTLQGTMRGLGNRMMAEFLPALTQVTDGLALVFVGDTEEGVQKINSGITEITNKLIELLPHCMEIGGQIIGVMASAFIQNLPTIASAIGQAIPVAIGKLGELVQQALDYIMANGPQMGESALELFMTIVTAIMNMAPQALAVLGLLLANLVVAIGGKVGQFFSGAVGLLTSFVGGIGSMAGSVVSSIMSALQGGIDYILSLPGQALQWGRDIVDSIANGIRNAIGSITSAVSDIASTIRSFLHFSEPDIGPLSDFHTYMPDMMEGIAEGMLAGRKKVQKAVGIVAGDISGGLSGNALESVSVASSGVSNADVVNAINALHADLEAIIRSATPDGITERQFGRLVRSYV